MTMQYDVSSTHLNQSGACYTDRTRIKGIALVGSANAGTLNLWDSTVAPTAATYGRSGYTVTVASNAHGLVTGQQVGITFSVAGGVSATNGNYIVTVTDANTFTITDINTGTVASSTVCNYVSSPVSNNLSPWLTSMDTAAFTGGAQTIFFNFPGEGLLCHRGIWATFSNMTGLTVFYG
jgi:hypothetical protein